MSATLTADTPATAPASQRPQPHRHPFRDPPYIGISVLSLVAALIAWEAAVRGLNVKLVILPAPSLVAAALWEYVRTGAILPDMLATLRRLLLGLGTGTVVGVSLGLLIGWYGKIRAALGPLVAVTFPVPKIALVPLFIIWFGVGDAYKIVLVVVGVFYIVLTNTVAGVESVPRTTIMACRNLGANDRQIFWKVILPAATPVVLAAFRISFSVSMILVIAAEMIISQDGLGHFIAYAGQLLETEKVFAGLVLSGIIGLVGYQAIDLAERWLVRWRSQQHLQL